MAETKNIDYLFLLARHIDKLSWPKSEYKKFIWMLASQFQKKGWLSVKQLDSITKASKYYKPIPDSFISIIEMNEVLTLPEKIDLKSTKRNDKHRSMKKIHDVIYNFDEPFYENYSGPIYHKKQKQKDCS